MPTINPEIGSVIKFLIMHIVDRPEDVNVHMIETAESTLIKCLVSPQDVGKLIGKQGKTARCIRTILSAAGKTSGRKYLLDISSNENRDVV